MIIRGSYLHKHVIQFLGAPPPFFFGGGGANFSKYCFETKQFTKLLELINLYKPEPLEVSPLSIIYKNYALFAGHKIISK